MRYIDNLIAWGDQLFRQDTMESINLATQLYVLASDLLGPKPEIVAPSVEPEPKTYSELKELDAFSNATVAAENVIPPVKVNVSIGSSGAGPRATRSPRRRRDPSQPHAAEFDRVGTAGQLAGKLERDLNQALRPLVGRGLEADLAAVHR
jgi:hypothetical protein